MRMSRRFKILAIVSILVALLLGQVLSDPIYRFGREGHNYVRVFRVRWNGPYASYKSCAEVNATLRKGMTVTQVYAAAGAEARTFPHVNAAIVVLRDGYVYVVMSVNPPYGLAQWEVHKDDM
jgi:hypothetical protein